MPKRVVVDSGPCIALFNRDDEYHEQALQFIRSTSAELLSTMAVVTQVMYVLDFSLQAQKDFLTWLRAGAMTLVEPHGEDFDRVKQLMDKYADLPMDFTDGVLVAVCERLEIRDVASVDKDFSVYRFKSRGRFTNVFFSEK